MRSFYQRKVHDIQQSHKKSIAALKKGETDIATAEYVIDTEQEVAMADDGGKAETHEMVSNSNQQINEDSPPKTKDGRESETVSAQIREKSSGDSPQQASSAFMLSNEIIGLHFQQQQQQYNQQQLVIMQQQNQIQQLENLIRLSTLNRTPSPQEAPVEKERPARKSNYSEFLTQPSNEVAVIQSELDMMRARVSRDEATISGLYQEIKELLVRNAQLAAEVELLNQAPKSPRFEQFQVCISFNAFNLFIMFRLAS